MVNNISRATQSRGRTTQPLTGPEEAASQEVATTNGNGHAVVAAEDLSWMEGYETTGAGLSQAQKDNLVPLATLIQVNAKRQNSAETAYIPGAEAGMVYIAALQENPLIDCRKGKWGSTEYNGPGLLVQVCFRRNGVAEWGKRVGASTGGFKGYHDLVGDDVEATMKELGAQLEPDPQNPQRKQWVRGDRVFAETRQDAMLLHVEYKDEKGVWRPTGEILPISLNYTSTAHTFAKGWMLQMNRRVFPTSGKRADMWLSLWRMHTKYRSDQRGSWFEWFNNCVGWANNPEHREQGKLLHQAFVSGEKEMSADDLGGGEANDIAAPAAGVM